MGQAIGGSLALAVGIAISPIPIIAVVLMLTTPRARANGPAFLAGWLLGLGIVGAMGERSQEMLTKLKDWLGRNNAVIMSILCLIIGAKLIGDAISGLTS
jgi:Sap, sulfolipid-1-addressing protein